MNDEWQNVKLSRVNRYYNEILPSLLKIHIMFAILCCTLVLFGHTIEESRKGRRSKINKIYVSVIAYTYFLWAAIVTKLLHCNRCLYRTNSAPLDIADLVFSRSMSLARILLFYWTIINLWSVLVCINNICLLIVLIFYYRSSCPSDCDQNLFIYNNLLIATLIMSSNIVQLQ